MSVVSILFLILVTVCLTFSSVLLIISQKKERGENNYLSAAFFIKGVLHLAPALLIFNFDISYSAYITGPIKVSILPLFYLYFVKLGIKEKGFAKSDLLHFIPLFIDLVFTLIVVPGHAAQVVHQAVNGASDLQKMVISGNLYFNILAVVGRGIVFFQGLVYTYLVIKLYQEYVVKMRHETSLITNDNLTWIKWTALMFCLAGLFSALEFFGVYSYLPLFLIMFLFWIYFPFYLFLHAFLQPDISFIENIETKSLNSQKFDEIEVLSKIANDFSDRFAEMQLFLNPELTLQEVSDQLNIPKYKITEIIKFKGYNNFYGFVNENRVEHSKLLLSNLPKYYSLDSVAIESGFKSRSTFYRVFKELTGQTPKQYLHS